ncbi:MAG: flagellar biosynthesis protein FlgJ [Candidatus Didemnitutus sp.]|nr:flagellar biosynthesis protein FlgJ [Candidatus Didemnitutus sp.]
MNVSAISPRQSAAQVASMMANPGKMQNLPQSEQVKAVAGQFEAILLRQFLQESVGSIMGGKEGGAGGGGSVYGYLLTDVLSNQLSAAGGLGLGNILQHQLTPRASLAADTAGQKD